MNRLLTALILFAALFVFSGCSDEGDPTKEIVVYDIVKLESQDKEGTVFTLQRPDSREMVTYTSPQHLVNDNLAVGDRVLISYVPLSGKPYESGEIRVKGYSLIINAVMVSLPADEIVGWDRDPVYLLSAWLSGDYLNLRMRLPYDENPRRFELARDESSDPAWPHLYLVHALETDIVTFDRAYYASFDISDLVATGAQGFTLHLNNSNLKLDEVSLTF